MGAYDDIINLPHPTSVTALGPVKKLDPLEGRLTLTDGTAIPIAVHSEQPPPL